MSWIKEELESNEHAVHFGLIAGGLVLLYLMYATPWFRESMLGRALTVAAVAFGFMFGLLFGRILLGLAFALLAFAIIAYGLWLLVMWVIEGGAWFAS